MISRRKLLKTAAGKVVTQTLAAAVLLNQFNPGIVKAANAPTKFIEAADLNTSETKYGLCTGKTPQKVYFGMNGSAPQGWFIAGYQEKGYGATRNEGAMVLVCDPTQPMSSDQQFCSDWQNVRARPCWSNASRKWEQVDVYPNCYGGSDIRAVVCRLTTDPDRFSATERGVMVRTPLITCD